MTNLTLSIDDTVLEQARARAQAMGTSVNQLVRDFIEQFARPEAGGQGQISELRRLSDLAQGHSGGIRFLRDELHDRS